MATVNFHNPWVEDLMAGERDQTCFLRTSINVWKGESLNGLRTREKSHRELGCLSRGGLRGQLNILVVSWQSQVCCCHFTVILKCHKGLIQCGPVVQSSSSPTLALRLFKCQNTHRRCVRSLYSCFGTRNGTGGSCMLLGCTGPRPCSILSHCKMVTDLWQPWVHFHV